MRTFRKFCRQQRNFVRSWPDSWSQHPAHLQLPTLTPSQYLCQRRWSVLNLLRSQSSLQQVGTSYRRLNPPVSRPSRQSLCGISWYQRNIAKSAFLHHPQGPTVSQHGMYTSAGQRTGVGSMPFIMVISRNNRPGSLMRRCLSSAILRMKPPQSWSRRSLDWIVNLERLRIGHLRPFFGAAAMALVAITGRCLP